MSSIFLLHLLFLLRELSICFVQMQPELASLISFKMRNIVLFYQLFVSFFPHRPRLKPLFSCTEPINNPVVAGDPLLSALKGKTIAVCTQLSIQLYVTYCDLCVTELRNSL